MFYNKHGEIMEKTFVTITSTQEINDEKISETFNGELYSLDDSDSMLSISYVDNQDKLITIKLLFVDESECNIKISQRDYEALINLKLDELTHGKYLFKSRTLELDFKLVKFFKKSLDILFEYDIFTNDKIISHNTLEIEVKKC